MHLRGKKAQAFAVYWIVRIILLFFVFVSAHLIKNQDVNSFLKTQDIEYDLVAKKLLFSPTGLSYYDLETGRVYPLIIDKQKVNEEHINNSINISSIAFKISVSYTNGTSALDPVYYNEKLFNLLLPLAFSEKYDLINQSYYVLLRDQGKDKPAIFNVDMVVSR